MIFFFFRQSQANFSPASSLYAKLSLKTNANSFGCGSALAVCITLSCWKGESIMLILSVSEKEQQELSES